MEIPHKIQNFFVRPLDYYFYFFMIIVSMGLLTTPWPALALLPSLTVLVLFILWRFPQCGYYMIIFLVPVTAYRAISEKYDFMTISKLVGGWLIVVLLASCVLKKKTLRLQSSSFHMIFLLLLITYALSAAFSPYFLNCLNDIRQLVSAYIIYFLTLLFISKRGFTKTLPMILVLTISAGAVLSIAGYMFDMPLFAMGLGSSSLKRSIGLASNPNHFAAMVIYALPLVWAMFYNAARISLRVIAVFLFLINLAAVILSYSRSGALVLMSVLAILTLCSKNCFRPRHIGFVLLGVAIFFSFAWRFIPVSYWERQKSMTHTQTDSSLGRRMSYLIVGWEAFKDNPLLGSGPGTFNNIYSTSSYAAYFAQKTGDYRRVAHNTYLEVIVGTGLIGFFFFLLILAITLMNYQKAERHFRSAGMEKMATWVRAYQISFVSQLIYFLFLSGNYEKYIWLSIGLSQVIKQFTGELGGGKSHDVSILDR